MRFSDPLRAQLVAALRERAEAGVQIRFCYDGDKPPQPNVAAGQDPAPAGTSAFVQSLGYPWRRIAGMKLMHSKFIVRDRQSVWTGSTNMTDDAFTLMENNILEIDSPALADYYAQDFEQLWEKENFENTGNIQTVPVPLTFSGQSAKARVMFSPGCGLEIDTEIARRVRAAQRRVRICSLLINSGTLIGELGNLLRAGRVAVDGIYDRTQMAEVYVPVAGSAVKSLEDRRAPGNRRARRSGREKLNALHPDRSPRFHAQQSPGHRRHRDHRLLQLLAQRPIQRREHSLHRKRRRSPRPTAPTSIT